MASIVKEWRIGCAPSAAWDAIRDIGALHTRLVPGFVTATMLTDGGRLVTFANGATVHEMIVTLDDEARRLVWTAEGGITTHYNAALEAVPDSQGTRVVWTVDFLPNTAQPAIGGAMAAAIAAMTAALGASASEVAPAAH